MNEQIKQIIIEILKISYGMPVLELKEFKKDWIEESQNKDIPEKITNLCVHIIDLIIERKNNGLQENNS